MTPAEHEAERRAQQAYGRRVNGKAEANGRHQKGRRRHGKGECESGGMNVVLTIPARHQEAICEAAKAQGESVRDWAYKTLLQAVKGDSQQQSRSRGRGRRRSPTQRINRSARR